MSGSETSTAGLAPGEVLFFISASFSDVSSGTFTTFREVLLEQGGESELITVHRSATCDFSGWLCGGGVGAGLGLGVQSCDREVLGALLKL